MFYVKLGNRADVAPAELLAEGERSNITSRESDSQRQFYASVGRNWIRSNPDAAIAWAQALEVEAKTKIHGDRVNVQYARQR